MEEVSNKEDGDRRNDADMNSEDADRDDRSHSNSAATEYSGGSGPLEAEVTAPQRGTEEANLGNKRTARMTQRVTERVMLGTQRGNANTKKAKGTVRRGRVTKRKPVYQRLQTNNKPSTRRATRAAPKRRPRRDDSISTIWSRLSSESGVRRCTQCGHTCCRRRAQDRVRGKVMKKPRNKKGQIKRNLGSSKKKAEKKDEEKIADARDFNKHLRQCRERKKKILKTGSEAIQVGSNTKMLSPLLVSVQGTSLTDEQPYSGSEPPLGYTEITPEMIYEVLRKLTMWQQIVPVPAILQQIKLMYPVNPDIEELTEELNEKLVVACVAGIIQEIYKNGEPYFWLSCDLMQRGLERNHVALFWKAYADTMSPVRGKKEVHIPPYKGPPQSGQPSAPPQPQGPEPSRTSSHEFDTIYA